MDWKKAAVEDLQKYTYKKLAIQNLKERIETLESRIESPSASISSTVPLHGGGNRAEARLIDNIAQRGRLEQNLASAERMVALIDKGLDTLTPEQRKLLEHFYIRQQKGQATRLALEMNIDRATVYRLREEALKNFTLAMFGFTEH